MVNLKQDFASLGQRREFICNRLVEWKLLPTIKSNTQNTVYNFFTNFSTQSKTNLSLLKSEVMNIKKSCLFQVVAMTQICTQLWNLPSLATPTYSSTVGCILAWCTDLKHFLLVLDYISPCLKRLAKLKVLRIMYVSHPVRENSLKKTLYWIEFKLG